MLKSDIGKANNELWHNFHLSLVVAPWFSVYGIIQALHAEFIDNDLTFESLGLYSPDEPHPKAPGFEQDINEYLLQEGIPWQLVNGEIVTRGNEAFENSVNSAVIVLEGDAMPTAAGHVKFAIAALSARPKANTSGAVSHATNAVECVLGEITGEAMTLGKYLDRYPDLFHPALQ